MLVDVHCHLDQFSDVQPIIKRAKDAGVKVIINNGVDPETNKKTLELAKSIDIVKPALGLHPEFIEKFPDDLIKKEISFIINNKNKI
ncbi:MAG: TatD family deoxyribonuclease, partial [Nitrospiraceae bacterium]|nr:TatD family deoxyribonuclease [Nitrospiraceae bacterium]